MKDGQPFDRPELTLPEAEAAWLREAYEGAEVILEYGSGGSTVMASEMPGKTIFSVESSKKWAAMMSGWFEENPGKSRPTVIPIFVGPVKQWGMPKDDTHYHRWPRYPLKVWDHEGFRQPDVVLVDGRFRIACLLATLYRTQKPVTLYFDDYTARTQYHIVEDFAPLIETRGRMARFDIEPTPIPPERLMQIMALFNRKL